MKRLQLFSVSGSIKNWGRQILNFLRVNRRLLLPMLIVLGAKLLSGSLLYFMTGMGSVDTYWMTINWDTEGQNAVLKSVATQGLRWPYLFLGWDSGWYLAIVSQGYAFSSKAFAFFPGFPALAWLSNLIMQNSVYALVVVSSVAGVLWIPVFQKIAEVYYDQSQALKSTLLFAFFPYVFLFTSVAYSEGLFLLFTLGAWYFHMKKQPARAILSASLATFSRPPGVIVALPIAIQTLRERKSRQDSFKIRNFLLLFVPFACLLAWFVYCQVAFGSWVPSGWEGMYSFWTLITNKISSVSFQALSDSIKVWPLSFMPVLFIPSGLLLTLALRRMDKYLALYSSVYLLGTLFVGSFASVPRFVSFMFPIFLPATTMLFSHTKHSSILTLTICASFFLIGLFLWYSFINGVFIA